MESVKLQLTLLKQKQKNYSQETIARFEQERDFLTTMIATTKQKIVLAREQSQLKDINHELKCSQRIEQNQQAEYVKMLKQVQNFKISQSEDQMSLSIKQNTQTAQQLKEVLDQVSRQISLNDFKITGLISGKILSAEQQSLKLVSAVQSDINRYNTIAQTVQKQIEQGMDKAFRLQEQVQLRQQEHDMLAELVGLQAMQSPVKQNLELERTTKRLKLRLSTCQKLRSSSYDRFQVQFDINRRLQSQERNCLSEKKRQLCELEQSITNQQLTISKLLAKISASNKPTTLKIESRLPPKPLTTINKTKPKLPLLKLPINVSENHLNWSQSEVMRMISPEIKLIQVQDQSTPKSNEQQRADFLQQLYQEDLQIQPKKQPTQIRRKSLKRSQTKQSSQFSSPYLSFVQSQQN